MEKQEQDTKKITMLRKIGYLFDRKQKIQFVGLGILILIGGLLETMSVSMLVPVVQGIMDPQALVDNSIMQKITGYLHIDMTGLILGEAANRLIVVMLVALMILFVLKNAYLLMQTYVQNTFVTRNRNRMISRVMREFLNRPYEEYLGADIPTVFRLTDSDIPNAFQLILVSIQLVTEVVVSAFLCVVLLIVSPVMTLFIVVIFLGMTLILAFLLKPRLNRIGRKNQEIQSRIAKWRIQSIYGLKDVKVLNREEFFIRNYYESGSIGANVARNYAVLNNLPRLLIETIFIVSMLAFIMVYMLGGGNMNVLIPQLTAFAVAAIRIMPSANRINTYISEIAYSQPCLDYLYENLNESMKLDVNGSVTGYGGTDESGRKEKLTLHDKIVLKDITFSYPGTDKNIFTDAHMEVKRGQSVGIMGPSGAGKSTIVDILLGLLHAQGGVITWDGRKK